MKIPPSLIPFFTQGVGCLAASKRVCMKTRQREPGGRVARQLLVITGWGLQGPV